MASRLAPHVVTAILLLAPASPAFATWSVIGVDQNSREVAIASATCVPQAAFANFPAKGLMDVQAIVVPGKGVAAAQAGVDRTRKNQQLIFDEIAKGTAPAEILEMLKQDPHIETRQFGIVDLRGRMTGFSGQKNLAASLNRATTGRMHRSRSLDGARSCHRRRTRWRRSCHGSGNGRAACRAAARGLGRFPC